MQVDVHTPFQNNIPALFKKKKENTKYKIK